MEDFVKESWSTAPNEQKVEFKVPEPPGTESQEQLASKLARASTIPTDSTLEELSKSSQLFQVERDECREKLRLTEQALNMKITSTEKKLAEKNLECGKTQVLLQTTSENLDKFRSALASLKVSNADVVKQNEHLVAAIEEKEELVAKLRADAALTKNFFSTSNNHKEAMNFIRLGKTADLPEPYSPHIASLQKLCDQDLCVVARASLQILSSVARHTVLSASLKEDLNNKDIGNLKHTMESIIAKHIESPGKEVNFELGIGEKSTPKPKKGGAAPKTPPTRTRARKPARSQVTKKPTLGQQIKEYSNDFTDESDNEKVMDNMLKVSKYAETNVHTLHRMFPASKVKPLCPEIDDVMRHVPNGNKFIMFGFQVYIATSTLVKPLKTCRINTKCSLEDCKKPVLKNERVGHVFIVQPTKNLTLSCLETIVCAHHVIPSLNPDGALHANRIAKRIFVQDSGLAASISKNSDKPETPTGAAVDAPNAEK